MICSQEDFAVPADHRVKIKESVAEIALAVGVQNYIFHPMRMTDDILPGHTSPGNVKGSANHAHPLFSFPPS